MIDRITNACLSCEVNHALGFYLGEECECFLRISEIKFMMLIAVVCLKSREPSSLQRNIVVVVDLVDSDDLVSPGEQPFCDGRANETRRSSHQDFHR